MVNFQVTAGSGTIIATDVGGGGENYQKIKLVDASIGSTAGTGISTNPFQVSLAFTGANTIPLLIDGSGVTQPISGTVAATQSGAWSLTNITGIISLPTGAATEATLAAVKLDLDQFTFVASNLLVDGSGVTQPISATALPLPTGAATQTTLAGIKNDTDNLDVALSTRATEATVSNIQAQTDKFTFVASNLLVDGSGVTQPVSGTVTANAGTGSFTVVQSVGTSLHTNVDNFPSSQTVNGTVAATQSGTWTVALSSGSIEIGTVDQGSPNTLGNAWPFELTDGTNILGTAVHPIRIDPTGTTTQPISGTIAATQSGAWSTGRTWTLTSGTDSISAVQSGTWNITNISGTVSLPTGAATSAKQPALGTAGTASSDVITVQGIASMTALKVDGSAVTQPVSGTVTANIGTTNGLALDATLTGGTQKTKLVDSAGTNLATISAAGALKVDGSAVTQPVSGTVTANAGTGSFTVAQATGTNLHTVVDSGTITANMGTTNGLALDATVAKLTLAQGSTTASQTGPLIQGAVTTASPAYTTAQISPFSLTTAGALRVDASATTQPISGTVTVGNATLAVTQSGTWTVSLSTESIEIGKVDQGTPNSLANAWPVELSDGTNLLGVSAHPVRIDPTGTTTQPVSGTVTANAGTGTFAISAASLPLPTGASTAAKQPALGTAGTASSDVITVQGIASMTALKVDGSAVTQPISGTVTANAGTGSFTVAQATGTNLHTVLDSGTLTSITNALPAGTNVIGHVITDSGSTTAVTGSVTVAQATAANLNATVVGSGNFTVVQPTASSLNATVTQQPITKGTQGANGVTTQDLKDAGRTFVTFTADAIAGVTTEALVTFSVNKAGTVTASQTNYTITNGKTLRIQALSASVQAGAAAGEWVRAKLRINTAGATTATSPLVITVEAGNIAATTATAGSAVVSIPDGLEIAGNGTITIGISHLSSATTNAESITLIGYEY